MNAPRQFLFAASMAVIGFMLAANSTALAQSDGSDIDCTNPQVQVEMTFCAGKDLEAADAELNAAYREAMKRAKAMDKDGLYGPVPVADMLRDAQRAWIPFRDRACEVQAALWSNGTGASMAYLVCQTGLTEERTEGLRRFIGFPD